MLYIINNKYYIHRDRKYVEVDVSLIGNELNITPKKDSVIEDNDIQSNTILIDDLIDKLVKERDSFSRSENKHRYDR